MSVRVRIATVTLLMGGGLSCKGLSPYNPDGIIDDSGIPDTESDTDTDVDTDTDTDVEPLSVSSVEPSYGTTAGGTTVTIVGGPFDASARVFFGAGVDETEGTVVSATSDQVTARTPAFSGETGIVDVKVATDSHAGTGNSLFQYFTDGTGLHGVLGEVSLIYTAGNYWVEEPDPRSEGFARVFFLDPPMDLDWGELMFAPSADQCRLDYVYDESVYVREIGVPAVRLDIPGSTNTLNISQDSTDTWYYYSEFAAASYVQNGSYDLRAMTGSTTGFPAIEATGFVSTPGSFQVTSPALNASDAPTITQGSFTLQWTGAGGGDYMVAFLRRYYGTGYEDVSCVMNDDGNFRVPSSAFTGWTYGEPLYIQVGRVRQQGGSLPHDNSTSGVVGAYWISGAGFQI